MRFARLFRLLAVMVGLALAGLALATPASATESHSKPATSHHHHKKASSTITIKGGHTSLTVASGTLAVLTKNGVSVTPIKPASASGATFSFPITGGSLQAKTLAGKITHDGGLTFTAGKTSLGVEDFTIDTAKGVLTARVSGTHTRVPLLKLDLSGAKISNKWGCLTVSNVKASLTAEAAAALNKTFKVSLFTAGLPVGTAKVSARTR